MRVAHYTRQGADPCSLAMLRQQVEYSVKPRREPRCIATGSFGKRRVDKGAERRAHQNDNGKFGCPAIGGLKRHGETERAGSLHGLPDQVRH